MEGPNLHQWWKCLQGIESTMVATGRKISVQSYLRKRTYTQIYTAHKLYTITDIKVFPSNVTLLNFVIFLKIFFPGLQVPLHYITRLLCTLKILNFAIFTIFDHFREILLPV